MCSHFEQCRGPLEKEKLLQVSSDGPNLNWHFFKVLTEKRKDEELNQLIDLGHASAYEACDRPRMPLHTPKTLETC